MIALVMPFVVACTWTGLIDIDQIQTIFIMPWPRPCFVLCCSLDNELWP